jgi:HprK-related kinase A
VSDLNLSSLSLAELEGRLNAPGIYLRTGAFITHIRSSIASVAEGLGRLYADYPLAARDDFADFHVSLDRPANFRRWVKPQVLFRFDGKSPFKPLPFDQAFPMLEWGLNWCVSSHANQYLIIHAAVVEKEGFAAILPAPPGSGKSTLCAALINRGWRLLSDELALVSIADGKIVPLPRPVSLKNAAIDVIRDYVPDAVFSRKVMDTMKGTVSHLKVPPDSVKRAGETAQPAWIIFPKYQPGSSAQLVALPQSRAFLRVAENAFNFSALGSTGFETLANVIDGARCFEFTYSALDDAIDTFSSLKPMAAVA